MWKRSAAAVALILGLLASMATPALAEDDDDEVIDRFYETLIEFGWDVPLELTDDTIANLMLKIALLDELDAFEGALPKEMQDLADDLRYPPDIDPESLRMLVFELDAILSFLRSEIRDMTGIPEQRFMSALGDMTPDWRNRLLDGETGFIPIEPYNRALSVLLSEDTVDRIPSADRWVVSEELQFIVDGTMLSGMFKELLDAGSGPPPATLDAADGASFRESPPDGGRGGFGEIPNGPPPESGPDTADQEPGTDSTESDTTNSESDPGAADVAVASGGTDPKEDTAEGTQDGALGTARPWLAVGLVLVMITVVYAAGRRRRGRRTAAADPGDATHRLINAGSEQEVTTVTIADAMQRTGAESAFLIRCDEDGCWHAGTGDPAVGSNITEAIETGQAVVKVLEDDPVVGPGSHAVAAVPVVAYGAVIGMLGVTGPAKHPFGADVRTQLDRLAPAVAAALLNIDRLGSIAELAFVDGLTALGNRRRLDYDLESILEPGGSEGPPVAFAMIDVDNFKMYNDAHGHVAGDEALRQVAAVIAANVREDDVVYRYGGEEFSILFPMTLSAEAEKIARRVREAVEATPFPGEASQPGGKLTVSVGVAALADTTPDDMKNRADQALYQAKEAGRNQVMLDA